MRQSHLASFVVAAFLSSAAAHAALDTFDGYANNSNIGGQSNGQVNWSTTLVTGDTAQANNGDFQSSPNSLRIVEPASSTQTSLIQARPSGGGLNHAVGSTLTVEFDYKAVGTRSGLAFRPYWSTDAAGTDEDNIANSQQTGTSSGGYFFVNNGNVLGAQLYDADVWYHIVLTFTHPSSGSRNVQMTMTPVGSGTPLDTLSQTGMSDGGRPFLTMFELRTTSESDKTTLIDNFSMTLVPEPASTATLAMLAAGAGLATRRRRRRNTHV
jgi:MYXO-CTERM domain-containing protein